ncbi:hypothetical protein JEQ12_017712 [Ovis aries]|uniref:Uncharacterized protein n=1 Tax=Ovis aries TaxID=9940 RepID=A0A836CZP6_SHEEP|nr:hypothetical protein JEQ12_017712 [Ovis aries]
MGAEPPPALQSPELLGPGPLGQQSAASVWLSHHGFLQVLQHLKRKLGQRGPEKEDSHTLLLKQDMVSKLKSSEPRAEIKRAWQWLGPRARQNSSYDYSSSRGPKGPTRCSELLSPLSTLPTTGEHSTNGRGQIETQGPRGLDA